MRVARQLSIPVLSGFHTNFHVYCRHYGLKALETLALAWLRRFHRQTDCTLVPTGDMQNMLTALGLDPVRVLGRGVDNDLFTPARRDQALREQGLAPDDLAVIYVIAGGERTCRSQSAPSGSGRRLRHALHLWRRRRSAR